MIHELDNVKLVTTESHQLHFRATGWPNRLLLMTLKTPRSGPDLMGGCLTSTTRMSPKVFCGSSSSQAVMCDAEQIETVLACQRGAPGIAPNAPLLLWVSPAATRAARNQQKYCTIQCCSSSFIRLLLYRSIDLAIVRSVLVVIISWSYGTSYDSFTPRLYHTPNST